MTTVNEAIKALKEIEQQGFGGSEIRCYTELGNDTYKPAEFLFHPSSENDGIYSTDYGDWVEVK